jgi:hypothetical protein
MLQVYNQPSFPIYHYPLRKCLISYTNNTRILFFPDGFFTSGQRYLVYFIGDYIVVDLIKLLEKRKIALENLPALGKIVRREKIVGHLLKTIENDCISCNQGSV